jgi:hypothetical protein
MQWYYGKILALYGESLFPPAVYNLPSQVVCQAYFDGGVMWKRFPSQLMPLAVDAKSGNRFVSVAYQGDDIRGMYVW